MSTRSIIAEPYGDTFRGRYSHSDGYPTWNGRELWNLVKRDGLETARQTLIHENFYWSSIQSESDYTLGAGRDVDGRFKSVSGYGIAGTESQASPDEWIVGNSGDLWGTEWAYVLADPFLMVYEVHTDWGSDGGDDTLKLVGTFRWDEAEPDWSKVEGGVCCD